MFQRSKSQLVNYMRLHNRKTARQYSAEYGKVWTKGITPRTEQDVQLYGWFHNYPYHNQNDLTWWADRRRPRHTIAMYALRAAPCSIFASLMRSQETTVIHQLSIGGGTTLILPTDDAFEDGGLLEKLRADPVACRRFLLSHAVQGELSVRAIVQKCKQSKSGRIGIKTLSGQPVGVQINGSLEQGTREILLQNAKAINHGIRCSNGVVFVVNGLLAS